LNAVGLQEFITNTQENYIGKAQELASATDLLVEMRLGMRNRLKSSPLMDAKAFARNFETALDEIAAAL
jgi:protein O-GlcNAc transferase